MELTDLFIGQVPWVAKKVSPGKIKNMAVCSVLSCFRNLSATPFLEGMSPEQREESGQKILAFLIKRKKDSSLQRRLSELSPNEAVMLQERFLLPDSFSGGTGQGETGRHIRDTRIVLFSEGRWSALLHFGEHIVMNRFEPGYLSSKNGLEIVSEMLETIAWEKWALTPKTGYLTADPAKAGSGFRIAMLTHWPGTFLLRQQDKLLNAMRASGLKVQGNGRLSGNGGLIWILSRGSMGKSEMEVVTDFSANLDRFLEMERNIQETLLKRDKIRLEDKVFRSLSILKSARSLSYPEFLELGSMVRLGVYWGLMDAGILEIISLLMVKSAGGHIQLGEPGQLSPEAQNAMRATMVRLSLQQYGQ